MTRSRFKLREFSFWQSGMTLLENLIAGAILAVLLGMVVVTFRNLKNYQARLAAKQAQARAINTVVQRVKTVAALRPKATTDGISMTDALTELKSMAEENDHDKAMPIVWTINRVEGLEELKTPTYAENKAKCPLCPGRLGYTLNPLSDFPGAYVLTLALSHPEIYGKVKISETQEKDIIVYKQYIIGGR